jgi:hypothetical protein
MNTSRHDVSTSDPGTVQGTTSDPVPTVAPGAGSQGPFGTASQLPGGPLPAAEQPDLGVGTEGEFSVWDGRYSFKNFIMRIVVKVDQV